MRLIRTPPISPTWNLKNTGVKHTFSFRFLSNPKESIDTYVFEIKLDWYRKSLLLLRIIVETIKLLSLLSYRALFSRVAHQFSTRWNASIRS